eukprot:NODE_3799_length_881_cov_2.216346_g3156_i0.p2 GENE.NODE_3799_length_881_cov_2.216346_g3156_i0~~NODE_3799_length_881_cov_2.216346_g3156_i0.p2  ORF type:complete len:89 (-),score=3.02 NODE_3799_length_881_cov_2.216346_g3156_i0:427-693(-)
MVKKDQNLKKMARVCQLLNIPTPRVLRASRAEPNSAAFGTPARLVAPKADQPSSPARKRSFSRPLRSLLLRAKQFSQKTAENFACEIF